VPVSPTLPIVPLLPVPFLPMVFLLVPFYRTPSQVVSVLYKIKGVDQFENS